MRTIHTVTKNFSIYIFLLHHLYIYLSSNYPEHNKNFHSIPIFFFIQIVLLSIQKYHRKICTFFLHFSLASLPFWLFFFILFFFIAFATFNNFLTQHALITKRSLTHLVGSQDARIMNWARLREWKKYGKYSVRVAVLCGTWTKIIYIYISELRGSKERENNFAVFFFIRDGFLMQAVVVDAGKSQRKRTFPTIKSKSGYS